MNPRRTVIALSVALALLTSPVIAGPQYKCTATTQECLDMMVASYKNKGWLGLEYEWEEATHSMLITDIVPEGPAKKAGFRIGDRVAAMEGVAFLDENEKKLAEVQKRRAPGAYFTFTVLRNGKSKDIGVVLGTFPDDIIARSVGRHMLEHVTPEEGREASKKDGR